MGYCGNRGCKKQKRHKRKKYSSSGCGEKRYKRDKIVRTTKCKGGCLPTTSQIVQATQPFGGVYTKNCDSITGRGTVGSNTLGCAGCGLGNGVRGVTCGMDSRFDPLTSGSQYGSTESHLHMDRLGTISVHSHPGGDYPHSHDACGDDRYLGRVSDPRSLTTNPDCLDQDVLGGIRGACGADSNCAVGQRCVGGFCCPSTTNLGGQDAENEMRYRSTAGSGLTSTVRSTFTSCGSNLAGCGNIGGPRPYNGDLVGGFRDSVGCGVGCNSCRLTSASYCNGSTLGHCNVACSVPANSNTLPAASLNAGAKVPDLRGFNNEGMSCITGSLCRTKRPTVCKTKIKEVYCC